MCVFNKFNRTTYPDHFVVFFNVFHSILLSDMRESNVFDVSFNAGTTIIFTNVFSLTVSTVTCSFLT